MWPNEMVPLQIDRAMDVRRYLGYVGLTPASSSDPAIRDAAERALWRRLRI